MLRKSWCFIPKYIELTGDFDFGVEQLIYLVEQCGFPWLIGNVFDGEKPLGNALQTYILMASNGIKIGLMGLVEKSVIPPDGAY
jgi:5'-nucleotidase